MRDSEGEEEKVKMEKNGANFASTLSPYIPPRKLDAKPVKELKEAKYGTFTSLFPESVQFMGESLGKIP